MFSSNMFPAGIFGFTFLLIALLQMPEKDQKQREQQNAKQNTVILAPKREFSTPSPSLPPSTSSSPTYSTGAPPAAAPVDQKKFADAALKMIAEDMLPLR